MVAIAELSVFLTKKYQLSVLLSMNDIVVSTSRYILRGQGWSEYPVPCGDQSRGSSVPLESLYIPDHEIAK